MPRTKGPDKRIEKICPTCNLSFKTNDWGGRIKIYCSKKCSTNNPAVKEKNRQGVKKAFDEKYGCHPMQTDITKAKFNSTIKEKYGVDWFSQSDGWENKVKSTLLERYGSETYNNQEQMEKTCLERYGVKNAAQYQPIQDQIQEVKKEVFYDKLIELLNSKKITFTPTLEEYDGYHWSNKYKMTCNVCNHTFEHDVYQPQEIECGKCNPYARCKQENTLFEFLHSILSPKGITINRRDRQLIKPEELDFYIPDLKLAIEFNGLFWHSENGGKKNKVYHLNKMKRCLTNGVRLIHLTEYDWKHNEKLVKSILNHITKSGTQENLQARKCTIRELSPSEKNDFLNENHIQGEDKSAIKYGLIHNDKIVSVMTFCKSRYDKSFEWEISRYCNLINTNIAGGASKLLSHFKKEVNPENIVTYSDRSLFSGEIYSTLGFTFVDNTPPAYHYISNDYKRTFNRQMFQKHMLKDQLTNFDETKTEWENMQSHGFDRIWDCGHSKWIWKR